MEFSSPIQVIGLTYHELLWKWVSDDCNHLRLLVRKIISIYLFSRLLRKSKGAGDARKNVYKQRAWIVLKTQVINREMQLPVGFLFLWYTVCSLLLRSKHTFYSVIRFCSVLFCSVLFCPVWFRFIRLFHLNSGIKIIDVVFRCVCAQYARFTYFSKYGERQANKVNHFIVDLELLTISNR